MFTLAAADTLAGVAQTAAKLTCTIFGMEFSGGVEVYKALAQSQLAAAAANIYTVPGSTQAFVRSIMVVNTDVANTQTFQLFRGGTGASNAITPVLTLPAGGMAVYEDGAGWMVFNSLGQAMSSTTAGLISAILTSDTANQISTTEAIVSPILTVPANYLTAGSTFDIQLAFSGAQGATAQTTPGILFQLRWGGITGTVIASVGTITPATLLVATAGYLRALMTIRTIGASGTAKGGIIVHDPRGTRIAAGDIPGKAGMSTAGTGISIDTTAAKDLVVTCKTTVVDASAVTFGIAGMTLLERA